MKRKVSQVTNLNEKIKGIIRESIVAQEALSRREIENIEKASVIIIGSLKAGGKLLVFGNGGSAADSQHMAAELAGRFKKERRPLPCVALTVNTSVLTAIANDYGYDLTFARQVEAIGKKGDVALGISTSGNSRNVVAALKSAASIGMKTIGLTGGDGGAMRKECGVSIIAASKNTPRIQESHITVCHILCELIEDALAE